MGEAMSDDAIGQGAAEALHATMSHAPPPAECEWCRRRARRLLDELALAGLAVVPRDAAAAGEAGEAVLRLVERADAAEGYVAIVHGAGAWYALVRADDAACGDEELARGAGVDLKAAADALRWSDGR